MIGYFSSFPWFFIITSQEGLYWFLIRDPWIGMRVRDWVRMRFSNFQLVLSREGMWRDILSIPDLLLKWLFFGPFRASLVLFTWFIKEMILARMATVFSKAFANSSKAASSRQSLNHAMDFVFVKLFSVTYLGSYLVRKCKTQQSCRQTVKQLSPWQRLTHNSSSRDHFLNPLNETNGAWDGLK